MDLRYRPSPIKRSKNSGLSSKSRSGRSRGCRRASACSRARPLAHNPSQARAPQVGVRLTISPSRCAPVPFLHTIYPSPKNNPPPPPLSIIVRYMMAQPSGGVGPAHTHRTRLPNSNARSIAGRPRCCAARLRPWRRYRKRHSRTCRAAGSRRCSRTRAR